MSDIKLFRVTSSGAEEMAGTSVQIEKTMQNLIEQNLEVLLGVRFLATEYSTGKTHRGRIDTLGLDENNNPVIIEYKRSINENVINQGLFYLDWLLDHQAEFSLLAMKMLGQEIEAQIDWSGPRLVCIAGDFTRYDEHAVSQINRYIELIRYRRYGTDYLVLELVNSQSTTDGGLPKAAPSTSTHTSKESTVEEYLAKASPELRDLFSDVDRFLRALGDDVQPKVLKHYFAYRRLKNFACIQISPQVANLYAYLKVSPDAVEIEPGFTRDVRHIGHFGTGDLEVTIKTKSDFERAKPYILASYERS